MVQGISLVLVTAFVVVNVIVDVLYAVLDPRVALEPSPMSTFCQSRAGPGAGAGPNAARLRYPGAEDRLPTTMRSAREGGQR